MRVGWVGRGGRSPVIIATIAGVDLRSPNGIASVNAWDGSRLRPNVNYSLVTYLDHDHREGENICLLAVRPLLVQNLWRSPSCGKNPLTRAASYGIYVLSDCSKTEIRNPWVAVGVCEDIWLDVCQCDGKLGLEQSRTPLRSA